MLCVVLPGPPRELHPMFRAVAAARLAPRSGGRGIFRQVLIVAGTNRVHVEEAAQPVYSRWRSRFPPCTPASSRRSVRSSSISRLPVSMPMRPTRADGGEGGAREVLGTNLVSTDGSPLEVVVGRLLVQRESAVAVAESCTGRVDHLEADRYPGKLCPMCTRVGSSIAMKRRRNCWVSIRSSSRTTERSANRSPRRWRSVPASARAWSTRWGSPASPDPVGSRGISRSERSTSLSRARMHLPQVRRLRLPGERQRVKYQASQAALDMLRRVLLR